MYNIKFEPTDFIVDRMEICNNFNVAKMNNQRHMVHDWSFFHWFLETFVLSHQAKFLTSCGTCTQAENKNFWNPFHTKTSTHAKWQKVDGWFRGLLKFLNWNVLGMKMVDRKNVDQVGKWVTHIFTSSRIFFKNPFHTHFSTNCASRGQTRLTELGSLKMLQSQHEKHESKVSHQLEHAHRWKIKK